MTVRELIEQLSRQNPDERVLVRDVEGDLANVDDVQALTLRMGRWGDEPVVYVSSGTTHASSW